jgi:hypothetical protein
LAILDKLSPGLTSWILVAVELEPLLTFEKSGMSLIGLPLHVGRTSGHSKIHIALCISIEPRNSM